MEKKVLKELQEHLDEDHDPGERGNNEIIVLIDSDTTIAEKVSKMSLDEIEMNQDIIMEARKKLKETLSLMTQTGKLLCEARSKAKSKANAKSQAESKKAKTKAKNQKRERISILCKELTIIERKLKKHFGCIVSDKITTKRSSKSG